jgi:hypothetical protein
MLVEPIRRAIPWLRLTALSGMLAFGGAIVAMAGPSAVAQTPGFCHENPHLCGQWTGYDCSDDCDPASAPVCCQPEPPDDP